MPKLDDTADLQPDKRGFWSVAWRVYETSSAKNLSHIAAGVAFYMLFAMFPAIAVAIAVSAMVFEPSEVLDLTRLLQPLMPADVYALLEGLVADQLENTRADGGFGLGLTAVVSFVLAFWSASGAVRALITALKIAFPATRNYGLISFYALSLLITLMAVCGVLLAIGLMLLLPAALNALQFALAQVTPAQLAELQLPELSPEAIGWLEFPIMLAVGAFLLTLIYRFGAARGGTRRWRSAFLAGLAATAIWAAGSKLLSLYIVEFGDFSKTYGPLGSIAGLMLWFWLAAFALLLGAEIAALLSGNSRPQEEDASGERSA